MSDTYTKLLILLADIRVAAGDANGDLSHAELVERIKGQRRDSERLQAELSELRKDKARLDWLDRSAYSLIPVADSEDSYHWQIREGDVLDGTIVAISGSEDPRRCIDLAMAEEVSS